MLPWMQEKLSGSRQRLMSIFSRRPDSDMRPAPQNMENTDVSDGNALCTEMIEVTFISPEGDNVTVEAPIDCTVEKLKAIALNRFYSSVGSAKSAGNYKLVSVFGRKTLDGSNSVALENLKTNDQILLIKRRQPPVKEKISADRIRAPGSDDIEDATSTLEAKNATNRQPPFACSLEFESGIRKALISLVEASARLLTSSPDSDEVFQIIRERLENKGIDHIIKQLTDMGFPQPLVIEALHLNSMNPRLALAWLLKHSSVKPGELCDKMPTGETVSSSSSKETGATEVNKKEKKTVIQSVESLLDSFRSFKRQYFKPDYNAVEKLKDMGFKEKDIIDALQVTGNRETSACEWLLGERRKSLEDLDTGLDPESPVYKAIMANPAIQLSLRNPKILLAFLSMLENSSNTNVWINDPDTAPVLSQIFKTYNTEKHVQPTDEAE